MTTSVVPHPFAFAICFLTGTTRPRRGFLIGEWYYLRGVRLITGMIVVGTVADAVVVPTKFAPVELDQKA
ncbi:MAG: hypothetical protein NVS9B6_13210 [Candidatus Limnocylindrales bacterium]